jgi:hypothetical protein
VSSATKSIGWKVVDCCCIVAVGVCVCALGSDGACYISETWCGPMLYGADGGASRGLDAVRRALDGALKRSSSLFNRAIQ